MAEPWVPNLKYANVNTMKTRLGLEDPAWADLLKNVLAVHHDMTTICPFWGNFRAKWESIPGRSIEQSKVTIKEKIAHIFPSKTSDEVIAATALNRVYRARESWRDAKGRQRRPAAKDAEPVPQDEPEQQSAEDGASHRDTTTYTDNEIDSNDMSSWRGHLSDEALSTEGIHDAGSPRNDPKRRAVTHTTYTETRVCSSSESPMLVPRTPPQSDISDQQSQRSRGKVSSNGLAEYCEVHVESERASDQTQETGSQVQGSVRTSNKRKNDEDYTPGHTKKIPRLLDQEQDDHSHQGKPSLSMRPASQLHEIQKKRLIVKLRLPIEATNQSRSVRHVNGLANLEHDTLRDGSARNRSPAPDQLTLGEIEQEDTADNVAEEQPLIDGPIQAIPPGEVRSPSTHDQQLDTAEKEADEQETRKQDTEPSDIEELLAPVRTTSKAMREQHLKKIRELKATNDEHMSELEASLRTNTSALRERIVTEKNTMIQSLKSQYEETTKAHNIVLWTMKGEKERLDLSLQAQTEETAQARCAAEVSKMEKLSLQQLLEEKVKELNTIRESNQALQTEIDKLMLSKDEASTTLKRLSELNSEHEKFERSFSKLEVDHNELLSVASDLRQSLDRTSHDKTELQSKLKACDEDRAKAVGQITSIHEVLKQTSEREKPLQTSLSDIQARRTAENLREYLSKVLIKEQNLQTTIDSQRKRIKEQSDALEDHNKKVSIPRKVDSRATRSLQDEVRTLKSLVSRLQKETEQLPKSRHREKSIDKLLEKYEAARIQSAARLIRLEAVYGEHKQLKQQYEALFNEARNPDGTADFFTIDPILSDRKKALVQEVDSLKKEKFRYVRDFADLVYVMFSQIGEECNTEILGRMMQDHGIKEEVVCDIMSRQKDWEPFVMVATYDTIAKDALDRKMTTPLPAADAAQYLGRQ